MVFSLRIGYRCLKEPKEIKERLYNYFKSYFNCSVRRWKMGLDLKFKTFSEVRMRKLEESFSMREIKEAIWSCDESKAPGPDDFNLCFFRKCWETVKDDLCDLLSEFFSTGKLEKSLNSSFITLIPKVENPVEITDFRPICLVSSLYKIVSKVLSRRLREMVGEVVSDTQCTFIKGRQRGWMMECISTAQAAVIINGFSTKEFGFRRRLRQGDPLSPFLFILVAEVLHLVLDSVVELGLIEGFKNIISGLDFSHLQFADDTILFLKADDIEVSNVKYILRCFKLFTGLSINFKKSCLVGFNVNEELLSRLTAICKCKIGSLSFDYLGIPLGANPKRIANWNLIIDRIRRKLAGWKCHSLSWAGRVVLINAVLSALPIYFMSLFCAPVTIIKRIDKIRWNFLWGSIDGKKKMAKIRWNIICNPKVNGGAEVVNLGVKNKALLAKCGERCVGEDSFYWKIGNGSGSTNWNEYFTRPLLEREVGLGKELAERVIGTNLNLNIEDRLCWVKDKEGVFSVKKCTELLMLEDEEIINFDFGRLWNTKEMFMVDCYSSSLLDNLASKKWIELENKAGCVGVLRDMEGVVRAIFSGVIFANNAEEAEIGVVKIALEVFIVMNWKPKEYLFIEVGSLVAFSWCVNKVSRPWLLHSVFADIERSMMKVGNIVFSLADRNGNGMAFSLAMAGVNRMEMFKAWWRCFSF
ncbi:hypothetical protein PVK06_018334 [Gossypium arboreum]|uniref:Reverse transcriptase domain-containing protein n=1 Tax=Gossypium arboreum TaxID=29729 RepID=A0ABR0Q614_GOSAR|nr:hypothetical protein PVK06_018334 [Gossypium arboreum]